jgi:myo-inositol-1(or 4)-monophosphatase
VLAGVILDPMRDEEWTAATGDGPRCNGEPVAPTGCRTASQALVATGFGYAAEVREVQAQGDRARAAADPRHPALGLGGARHGLARGGRCDAYFERGVKHWDIAAGMALCAGTGLEVRELAPLGAAPAAWWSRTRAGGRARASPRWLRRGPRAAASDSRCVSRRARRISPQWLS